MTVFDAEKTRKLVETRITHLRISLEQDRVLLNSIHHRFGVGTEHMKVATELALGNAFRDSCLSMREEGLAAFVRHECRTIVERQSGPAFLVQYMSQMAELRD